MIVSNLANLRACAPLRQLFLGAAVVVFTVGGPWRAEGQDMNTDELAKRGITIAMPGKSFQGPLPELTPLQLQVRNTLRTDLVKLAGEIGERNVRRPEAYDAATKFLEGRLSSAGHKVRRQTFPAQGRPCANLEVEIKGSEKAEEIIVVGAHYDSGAGTPGANDNGTGAVSILALADLLKDHKPRRTIRLVEFANEESPFFGTDAMGSLVCAREYRDRGDKVVAMLSLETMGYFDDAPGSQKYPPPFNKFYPTTGNFIAFVGNTESSELVKRAVGSFRKHAQFPCEGGAAPAVHEGISRSDQVAFWKCGFPGLMVTDTANFRYPHYHLPTDTPEKIIYDRLARVVVGLRDVIVELGNE